MIIMVGGSCEISEVALDNVMKGLEDIIRDMKDNDYDNSVIKELDKAVNDLYKYGEKCLGL